MRKVRAAKADAVLVTQPQDVGYLSGFSGEDSWLVVAGRWARLITDGRFAEQARCDCADIEIDVRKCTSLARAVGQAVRGRSVRRLAVQSESMTLAGRQRLGGQIGRRKVVPMSGLTDGRLIKDAGELKAIRKAVGIAETAFNSLRARGAKAFVGKTERRIAAELDYQMALAGADRAAFETVAAAGPNSSRCHHVSGRRRVARPDALLLDFGAVVDGYHSDLTRVLFMGRISAKLGQVYQAVLRGQQAGIAALGPGVKCKTADSAARRIIQDAGHGDAFVHGLGHGLGMQVHEAPALSAESTARLRAGMVVTVEPGIYLPGIGGIRIEDDVEITARGRRRLSSLPRTIESMLMR